MLLRETGGLDCVRSYKILSILVKEEEGKEQLMIVHLSMISCYAFVTRLVADFQILRLFFKDLIIFVLNSM